MEINTKTWKKFKVGDLFDAITKTCKVKLFEKSDQKSRLFNIPALSSTVSNNSFGYYVKECDHDLIDEISLSVTSNGDAGKVYVQTEAFAIAQDAYALKLKNDINYGKKQVYLFLATVLEKTLIQKYSYTNKAVWSRVKREHMLLPEKAGEPDWEFMALYIKEIKDKCIDKIEKLNDENIKKALKVAGLTEEDIDKELVLPVCDRYKEFEIGDLFYAKTRTDIGRMFSKQDFKDSIYDTPALSSTSVNNSIGYYVKMSEHILIVEVCLSITANGAYTGTLYLQTEPFAIAQDAYVLHLKEGLKNRNTYLYFKTLIEKITLQKYNYSNKAGWNKVKKEKILVPIIDENTPNFDFMEKYIYIYQSSLKIRNWITKERLS